MAETTEIHLGIAFDKNYLSPFYALITSIFKNNGGHHIVIHAIVTGLSEIEKEGINQYAAQHKCKLHYYLIDEHVTQKFVLIGKWTAAVYYRLFFPFLVPSTVRRLLYLDCDTLVINDLQELYSQDLEGYPMGAVYDNWVKSAPHIGIVEERKYFNSGVLLIDLQSWKEQKISEKAIDYLNSYPERIKYVDQDALNAVLIDNWKELSPKFNLMYSLIPEGISRRQIELFNEGVVVIHFTIHRPWHLLCRNRNRDLYYYYLKASPRRGHKPVIDFDWKKVPDLVKIRLVELYYDAPVVQKAWRAVKKRILKQS